MGRDRQGEDDPVYAGPYGQKTFSKGSELHNLGQCDPCAWYWRPPEGCSKSSDCQFCHACPKGESKARRRERVKLMKKERTEAKGAEAVAHAKASRRKADMKKN